MGSHATLLLPRTPYATPLGSPLLSRDCTSRGGGRGIHDEIISFRIRLIGSLAANMLALLVRLPPEFVNKIRNLGLASYQKYIAGYSARTNPTPWLRQREPRNICGGISADVWLRGLQGSAPTERLVPYPGWGFRFTLPF